MGPIATMVGNVLLIILHPPYTVQSFIQYSLKPAKHDYSSV